MAQLRSRRMCADCRPVIGGFSAGFSGYSVDFVTNNEVVEKTGYLDIRDTISLRRHSLFGHVRRLHEDTPTHVDLRLSIFTQHGGRPRNTWIRQLEEGMILDYQPICFGVSPRIGWFDVAQPDRERRR